jgi:hypothetical protein|tara:strand:+ start:142 stop:378 length:237 start_codon:yes stop_codon:yes gene_type:complete
MKNIQNTTEDGWDCVPELTEVVRKIESLDNYKYEINNCVRLSGLDNMIAEMKELLEDALEKLDEIDPKLEFKTVEIED